MGNFILLVVRSTWMQQHEMSSVRSVTAVTSRSLRSAGRTDADVEREAAIRN